MKNGSMLLLFLACSSNASTQTELVKSTTSWNGSTLSPISINSPEVTIKEYIIQPREAIPIIFNPALVINAGVVVSGELTIYTQDKKQTQNLKANTPNNSLVQMASLHDYIVNEGETPAKAIVFSIANKAQEVTIPKEKS